MSLLVSSEILESIKHELENANDSVRIITAYCKLDSIKKLAFSISERVEDKRIMIRFRLDDLLKKSTDFDVLKYCLDTEWQVFLHFNLHAKTYVVDDKRVIVGSANLTGRGLTGDNGNSEIATLSEIEEKDLKKIEAMFNEAIPVDEVILGKLKDQYENIKGDESSDNLQWSSEIIDMFDHKVNSLFSYELPNKPEFGESDYIDFLDIDGSVESKIIKDCLRKSKVYNWLINEVKKNNGEIYFGNLSAALHDALVEDPKPYRKDVKVLLSNLLSLIEQWNMEEIIIDRPNYSQRIRLK